MAERINVNGNYATVMTAQGKPDAVEMKVYVHTREGKFVTAGRLVMTEQYLKALLARVDLAKLERDQPMLPPWDQNPDDNVRWLPPQP